MSSGLSKDLILKTNQKRLLTRVSESFQEIGSYDAMLKESEQRLLKDEELQDELMEQLKKTGVKIFKDMSMEDLPSSARAAMEKTIASKIWHILNSKEYSEKFQVEVSKVLQNDQTKP